MLSLSKFGYFKVIHQTRKDPFLSIDQGKLHNYGTRHWVVLDDYLYICFNTIICFCSFGCFEIYVCVRGAFSVCILIFNIYYKYVTTSISYLSEWSLLEFKITLHMVACLEIFSYSIWKLIACKCIWNRICWVKECFFYWLNRQNSSVEPMISIW